MSSSPLAWLGFSAYILLLLALSLLAHRGQEHIGLGDALGWSAFWVANAAAVGGVTWLVAGRETALAYFTGYLIEESLSLDNLFVILTIFTYFSIPRARQHRVLFWGIVGAMFLRGLFILLGTELVERFHQVLYLFGAFLLYTSVQLLRGAEEEVEPERNVFLKLSRRFFPLAPDADPRHFFVRRGGRWAATPALVALLVIETTDVMFAFDSIPAIFSVTTDAFVVFTSNICAILGLRSFYFLLERFMGLFRYLRYGLAAILALVGLKLLLQAWFHPSILLSLGLVAGILLVSVLASVLADRQEAP